MFGRRAASFFTKHNQNFKNFGKSSRRFNSNNGASDKEKFFNEYGTRPEYLEQKRKTKFFPLFLVGGLVPLVLSPLFVDTWIRKDRAEGDPLVKEYEEHRAERKKLRENKQNDEQEVKVSSAAVTKKANEECKYKYVLIGGGTASYAALTQILKNDPNAKVLILTEENLAPYQRPPLSKELWGNKDVQQTEALRFTNWEGKEDTIEYKPVSEYKDNVTLKTKTKVTQLDTQNQTITTADGQVFSYEKCLIATGGSPRELPGSDLFPEKVTTFRTAEDFKKLEKATRQGGHVVIVGGSFLGTELSYSISQRKTGAKVTQVYLEQDLMARWLPRYLSERIRQTLQNIGVELRPNRNVLNVQKSNRDPEKVIVKLDNGDEIEADLVVTTTGIFPNTEIAEEAGLEIDPQNSGIVANSHLESVQNVYVAGDVLSYYDVVLGRRRHEHYDHAFQTGKHAGNNMSSSTGKKFHHISMFWSDVGDIHFQAVGEINSSLDTYALWNDVVVRQNGTPWSTAPAPVVASNYGSGVVYYIRDKKVVGILLWNLPDKLNHARKVILEKKPYANLDELKEKIKLN
ncbi:hypothetical protein ABK040_012401 [Willaertia magna]